MTRWEYLHVYADKINLMWEEKVDTFLNARGEEGWELVTLKEYYVGKDVRGLAFTFKRPK